MPPPALLPSCTSESCFLFLSYLALSVHPLCCVHALPNDVNRPGVHCVRGHGGAASYRGHGTTHSGASNGAHARS